MTTINVSQAAGYKTLVRGSPKARDTDLTGAGDYPLILNGAAQAGTTTGTNFALLYLNPAETPTLRIAAAAAVNATGPGRDLTLGIYPVGTPNGAQNVFNPNLGTVVTGTTIAFTSANLSAGAKVAETVNADIACPTAGFYCLGLNVAGGALTANSLVMFAVRVEYRS